MQHSPRSRWNTGKTSASPEKSGLFHGPRLTLSFECAILFISGEEVPPHVLGSTRLATNYQRGADFERRVARNLETLGYMWVRSAGSHSPADIIALRVGETLAVQCKTNGRIDPDEWNQFYCWARMAGVTPILASKGPHGRGIIYHRLTGRKDGRGRQPLVPWSPQREGNGDEVS